MKLGAKPKPCSVQHRGESRTPEHDARESAGFLYLGASCFACSTLYLLAKIFAMFLIEAENIVVLLEFVRPRKERRACRGQTFAEQTWVLTISTRPFDAEYAEIQPARELRSTRWRAAAR